MQGMALFTYLNINIIIKYTYILSTVKMLSFFNIGVVCALYEADTIVRTIFFCNLINTSL